MNQRRSVAFFLIPALFSAVATAGDLNPPMGPVAPTMKSLDAIEPRVCLNELPGNAAATHVITTSGSYYLTGDIHGDAGRDCVIVDLASDPTDDPSVSIDLNGYTIRADPASIHGVNIMNFGGGLFTLTSSVGTGMLTGGSGNGLHCVAAPGEPVQGINVTCCHVFRDWGGDGIHCENVCSVLASGGTVENVGGTGIVADNAALAVSTYEEVEIEYTTIRETGVHGVDIDSYDACTLTGLTVGNIGGTGIVAKNDSLAEGEHFPEVHIGLVSVGDTGGNGVEIDSADVCTVSGLTVSRSGGDACVVRFVSSFGVTEEGIKITAPTGNGLLVEDCDLVALANVTVANSGMDGVVCRRVSSLGIEEEGIGITAPGGDGLFVEDCDDSDCSGVSVTGGSGDGVVFGRDTSMVYLKVRLVDCIITGVAGSGVRVEDVDECHVSDAILSASGGDELRCVNAGTLGVAGVVCTGNEAFGFYGENIGSLAYVGPCSADVNGTAGGAGTPGMGGGALFVDCARVRVVDSSFSGNANDGLAITDSSGGSTTMAVHLERLTCSGNTGRGTVVTGRLGDIRHCVSSDNGGFGIETGASFSGTVKHISCVGNGGAILVNGTGCAVTCNSGTSGPLGFISVVTPGNVVGPLVDEMSVATSSNPHANILH